VFTYLKLCPDDNEYAHPLDVVPIVDLNSGEVGWGWGWGVATSDPQMTHIRSTNYLHASHTTPETDPEADQNIKSTTRNSTPTPGD